MSFPIPENWQLIEETEQYVVLLQNDKEASITVHSIEIPYFTTLKVEAEALIKQIMTGNPKFQFLDKGESTLENNEALWFIGLNDYVKTKAVLALSVDYQFYYIQFETVEPLYDKHIQIFENFINEFKFVQLKRTEGKILWIEELKKEFTSLKQKLKGKENQEK